MFPRKPRGTCVFHGESTIADDFTPVTAGIAGVPEIERRDPEVQFARPSQGAAQNSVSACTVSVNLLRLQQFNEAGGLCIQTAGGYVIQEMRKVG